METCKPSNMKIVMVLIYVLLLLASSAIPMDHEIQGLKFITNIKPTIQNLLHIPMYMVIAILLLQIFQNLQLTGWRTNILVLLGAGLIGFLSEIIQIVVPGRHSGLLDIGLNLIGTITGIAIYSMIKKTTPGLIKRIVCE